MANITTSYQVADRFGRAAFEQMDTYVQTVLLAGDFPELQAGFSFTVANNAAAMAQFTVVGLDANGFLVPAVRGTVQAIGVLCHATGAAAADNQTSKAVRGVVWLTGCFNVDGPLIWDASFDTEERKFAAFRGAPTPTQIVVRKRLTPAT
ncbi:hypothetical protein [Sphingomonas hankookensis]|uniref:hypothetical protein n=1 Tax=Sphingomonas hankookensis TaxID=563996 RepID=UPI003F790AF9